VSRTYTTSPFFLAWNVCRAAEGLREGLLLACVDPPPVVSAKSAPSASAREVTGAVFFVFFGFGFGFFFFF
jgi:hypothetical protein